MECSLLVFPLLKECSQFFFLGISNVYITLKASWKFETAIYLLITFSHFLPSSGREV